MIAIGSDHAGYSLKCEMIKHLEERALSSLTAAAMARASTTPISRRKPAKR